MNEKNIYLDMELLYKFDYVFGSKNFRRGTQKCKIR
mgnify:CR=1 FL=1